MPWSVDFLDTNVQQELEAMPRDIVASFLRIARLIAAHGLEKVHEPYVKHLEGRLWEMRKAGTVLRGRSTSRLRNGGS